MGIVYPIAVDTFSVPTLPEATSLSSAGTSKRNHTESHADLGAAVEALETYAAQFTHDHSGVGSPFATFKLQQENTHQNSDTDLSALSMHHTLGSGETQAAAGNHIHDYEGPSIINKPLVICTSATRPVTPQLGMMVYETDTNCVRVWAEFSPNNVFNPYGGLNVDNTFSSVNATSLGSGWSQSYYNSAARPSGSDPKQVQNDWTPAKPSDLLVNGSLASPSGAGAQWVTGKDVPFRCIARRTDPSDSTTLTDDQIITVAWNTPGTTFYYNYQVTAQTIESYASVPIWQAYTNSAPILGGIGEPAAGGVGSVGSVGGPTTFSNGTPAVPLTSSPASPGMVGGTYSVMPYTLGEVLYDTNFPGVGAIVVGLDPFDPNAAVMDPFTIPAPPVHQVSSATTVYTYTGGGAVPGMDVYARMSTDGQSYVRVSFNFFHYFIFYTTSGPAGEILIGSGLPTKTVPSTKSHQSWLDVESWTVRLSGDSVYIYVNYPNSTVSGYQGQYLMGSHPDVLKGRTNSGIGYRGWGYGCYATHKIGQGQGQPATLASITVEDPPVYASEVLWQLLAIGNVPHIRAEANASQSIIPITGSVLETGLTVEDWAIEPFKINQTDIVIREAGHYDINVSASWDPNYYNFDSAMISAEVNGEDIYRKSQSAMRGNGTAPGFAQTSSLSFCYYFALGDILRFRLSHNGTQPAKAAYIVAAPDRHTSWFELNFIGP